MAARAVIRDVARAMDIPYADADRLAKLVPEALKMTIEQALKLEPQLKKEYDEDENVRELLDIGMRLEGLSRHASTHAAGVVIAPEPLTDYAPLYKAPNEEAVTTQFDMVAAEQIGLIKFDFLGLKTLTVIQKTIEYLNADGIVVDIEKLPLDDTHTYEFLSSGKTTGVFQLESDGMKDILVKMRPSRFEDLIALVALYRPGPIKSGMIDDFIKRKKGEKAIEYELNQLKDILDETYGVIIYQEQVMSIANKLANFTMGQADVLRKAMGKKKLDVMAEQKELFIAGATKNKIPEDKATRLFDLMAFFAEYGFNKSHSAAYAYISYQTAYLKAHYPVHFMAATLSLDIDNTDKVVKNINECRNLGIEILPPDVNRCGREFTADGQSIRFGLGAVKGAGQGAVDAILEARAEGGPFDLFEDYLSRVDTKRINKKVSESLIKAGAFDSITSTDGSLDALGKWRSSLIDKVSVSNGTIPSLSLFGDEDPSALPDGAGWDEAELLKNEKDALGFYISGSPLNKYRRVLETLGIREIRSLEQREDKQEVEAAGIVMAVRKIRTRKGDIMAAVSLEDENGAVEAIVFPDLYQEHPDLVQKEVPLYALGTLEKSEKGLKVIAKELAHLDGLLEKNGNGRRAIITINGNGGSAKDALHDLLELAQAVSGSMPLYLTIRAGGAETLIQTSLSIQPDEAFIHKVEELFGHGTLKVV
jgi:DNA polymerase-3 subunit alpha